MELLGDVGHGESRIGPFGDGVSVGVRCTVCAKLSIATKFILDTPNGILGDEAPMEAHFGLFGHSANLETRIGRWFASKVPSPQKTFWRHPMVLLGDEAQV
jgi:hypothetical protein